MAGMGLVGQSVYPPAGASQAPGVGLQVWPTAPGEGLTHTPVVQTSVVHAMPSLHGAVLFWKTQPVAASHESSVQGLPSLHTRGVPGVQLPAWQVSTPLQALPSLQLVPFGALASAGAGLRPPRRRAPPPARRPGPRAPG